jgi:hypothetical protein
METLHLNRQSESAPTDTAPQDSTLPGNGGASGVRQRLTRASGMVAASQAAINNVLSSDSETSLRQSRQRSGQ